MNELVIGGPHRGPSVVTLAFDLAATSASLQDGGVTLEVVEADYDTLSSWLATGRIQLCRRGPDVDVVAAAGGAPVSSCAAVLQAVPADVVVQEGIADASALEGRKVAVIHPTMGSTLACRCWRRSTSTSVRSCSPPCRSPPRRSGPAGRHRGLPGGGDGRHRRAGERHHAGWRRRRGVRVDAGVADAILRRARSRRAGRRWCRGP